MAAWRIGLIVCLFLAPSICCPWEGLVLLGGNHVSGPGIRIGSILKPPSSLYAHEPHLRISVPPKDRPRIHQPLLLIYLAAALVTSFALLKSDRGSSPARTVQSSRREPRALGQKEPEVLESTRRRRTRITRAPSRSTPWFSWAALVSAGILFGFLVSAHRNLSFFGPQSLGVFVSIFTVGFVLAGIPWLAWKVLQKPLTLTQYLCTYAVATVLAGTMALTSDPVEKSSPAASSLQEIVETPTTAKPGVYTDARLWTASDGRTISAELVSCSENAVTIRRIPDGQQFTVDLSLLSPADQRYVRSIARSQLP